METLSSRRYGRPHNLGTPQAYGSIHLRIFMESKPPFLPSVVSRRNKRAKKTALDHFISLRISREETQQDRGFSLHQEEEAEGDDEAHQVKPYHLLRFSPPPHAIPNLGFLHPPSLSTEDETLVYPLTFPHLYLNFTRFPRFSLLVAVEFNQSGYSSLNFQRWKRIAAMQVSFCSVIPISASFRTSNFDIFADCGSDLTV